MSVKDFNAFVSSDDPALGVGGKCVKTVNLLNLVHSGGKTGQRTALVVDAENCLDRLYGGYFSGNYIT